MRTKITHVEERYQHFAIETAEQNRANLFDKIVTGRPNAYPTSKTPDIPAPETRSPTKAKGPHRTNRINPRSVPKLQPGTHVDGNGLLLIVRPSGSRSWVQRLVVRGRRVDIGLGGFPTTSLSEARRAALDNRRVARNGGDPRKPKAAKQLTFAEAEQAAYSEQHYALSAAALAKARTVDAEHMQHALDELRP